MANDFKLLARRLNPRVKGRLNPYTKPPPGAQLIRTHPQAHKLIVCLPLLEGRGNCTTEYANDDRYDCRKGNFDSTVGYWVSTPFGTGINFITTNLCYQGDRESPTHNPNIRRPSFVGKDVTFIWSGQVGDGALWKNVFDIASEDKIGANYDRLRPGVAPVANGGYMFCYVGSTRRGSLDVAPTPGDWGIFMARMRYNVALDFRYLSLITGQNDTGSVTCGLPTSTSKLIKLGNQDTISSSWGAPLIFMYMWSRYLSDKECDSVMAAPYQFFR